MTLSNFTNHFYIKQAGAGSPSFVPGGRNHLNPHSQTLVKKGDLHPAVCQELDPAHAVPDRAVGRAGLSPASACA